jgi:CHASE2 domain-containing sensor protein
VPTEKLVILKLDGNLEQQGFRATLEISIDGDSSGGETTSHRPSVEVNGFLPPASELVSQLNQWQQNYRTLGASTRITPQEIIYGGSVNRLDHCRQSAYSLRDYFTQWLESPGFRNIDRRLREVLNLQDVIRILIRTENYQLLQLPWHLWDVVERYPKAEIAFSALTSETALVTRSTIAKVRILAILGNSTGINIAADRALLEAIPDADVTFLVEPQHQELNDHLWDQHWDILFFAGHSTTQATQGRIFINPQDSLTLEELKYALRRAIAQGLQLAIFNSCDGLGLANELKQLNLPQLIVMREPVPDRVAQEFLKYFLNAFTQGESLYLSVRQARERLQGLESEFPCASWLPVMLQTSTTAPISWQTLLKSPPDIQQRAFVPTNRAVDVPVRSPQHQLRFLILLSWVVTTVLLGLRFFGTFQFLELAAFDQLMRLRPPEEPDGRIVLITIDEADLRYQDDMGMQRDGASLSEQALEQLFTQLNRYQPAVIGLDLYRSNEQPLPEEHRQNPSLIAICAIGEMGTASVAPPTGLSSEQIGFANVPLDAGDMIRRQLLGMAPDDSCTTDQSFSYRIALHYLATVGIKATMPGETLYVGDVPFPNLESHTGGYHQSDLKGYDILLNYRVANPVVPTVSLSDVLTGSLNTQLEALVSDRIVLIGTVARSYKDFHETPYGTMPGIMVQTHMVSQVISHVLDNRPLLWCLPQWGDALWIWGWAFIGGVLVLRVRSPYGVLISCSAVGVLYGICFVSLLHGAWLPFVPAVLALGITAYGVTLWKPQPYISSQS